MNDVFIKRNPSPGSESLACECKGLKLLAQHFNEHSIKTPRVISLTQNELTLERLAPGAPSTQDFFEFGQRLAALHHIHGAHFGLEYNNYIGLNPQANALSDNWGEFFFKYRLAFQVNLVRDKSLNEEFQTRLDKHKAALVAFLNEHRPAPSLLHGDLWSGNVIFSNQEFHLLDPAVYYGDRECDLAMTRLFGGFPPAFYEGYQQSSPLPAKWERRFTIYNLYHNLNHLNLFGGGYLSAVRGAFWEMELS